MSTPPSYCQVEDLLLGDVTVGGSINRQLYIDQAAEEMDSKLGWLYVTPISLTELPADPPDRPEAIPAPPRHQMLLLKSINARIATARLIMAVAIHEEDSKVHAYALHLLKEGTADLMLIANGDLILDVPRLDTPELEVLNRTPGVVNEDPESLMDAFYNMTNHGVPWYAQIGQDPRG